MVRDELIKKYYELNVDTNRIRDETNDIHRQANEILKNISTGQEALTKLLERNTSTTEYQQKYMYWLIRMLTIAVIILAGAKQIVEFIK
jgi:hypothetical protein